MRYVSTSRKNLFPLPNLSRVQLDSYEWFLTEGISEILEELGTIEDYSGKGWVLKLTNSKVDKPNITEEEAIRSGRTYDAPWYLTATISDPITKKDKSQNIYMGDIPLITNKGTFIINGVSRVVVNQLVRSEGVLFTGSPSPTTGKMLGGAKILPKNGVWLEIETSRSGAISVKIDRRRKIALTTLLRVFGLETDEDILKTFEHVDTDPEMSYIGATLAKDPASTRQEAAIEIYRKVRPGEPLILENAEALVEATFFNKRRYSLGKVGRFKTNITLGLDFPNEPKHRLLQLEDIVRIVEEVIKLNNGQRTVSDVDNLGNRRVKRVGELLQNEIRVGFLQMEKNVKERMSLQPREELPTPNILISPRAVASKVHSFFASGQLSQFLDQQNPLTSLDHLRRMSVLGKGGLTKERASMAVRDVHYTHFGRVCPVRTPEGQSIGLITYLAMYAYVNEFGFLETPYVKLLKEADGRIKITDEVTYLPAYEEDKHNITDRSVTVDDNGYITQTQVPLRRGSNYSLGSVTEAEYIELVPMQVVGISAGLIPFLSHDDVNRSLVATQQMSQAVPLVKAESPIVGTGVEDVIAQNTGYIIAAEHDGVVEYADSNKIIVDYAKIGKVTHKVHKFEQSNQDTSINQKVVVSSGQKVKKGDALAEGPSVVGGEISLGTNLLTAYMIWQGYEYEDGIIISDRLVKEDVLTSIHITDHKVQVLETKLGPEEVTRDIPNVPDDVLRHLDADGTVAVGSKVKAGDILVGKVAPKGDVELSAEERLLRAIFGEKAKEVKDNSLVMPHGEHGIVIAIKQVDKNDNNNLGAGVLREITVYVAQRRKIEVGDKLAGRHGNKGVISKIVPAIDMPHLEDGTAIDIIFSSEAVLKRMNVGQILEAPLGFAGRKLNKKYTIYNFEGEPYTYVQAQLAEAGLPLSGKMKLIDGRSGEYFKGDVVVGSTYILKLYHIAEEKMHARSTGPYSLITQQPLGGKAQFGGQRFGEMEVWALESYGARHVLQEILTIKSDDLVGRTQAYKSILQGEEIKESSVPESFKLLVREINGLCLGINPLGATLLTEEEASE
ncbi:MAG: hypothetical protein RLY61_595 [Candidatus Parcubacteria bacterium]